jgi:hypothetical protein
MTNHDDGGGVPLSTLPEAAAAVVNVIIVIIRFLDGCRPGRGGRRTQLPGGGGGS